MSFPRGFLMPEKLPVPPGFSFSLLTHSFRITDINHTLDKIPDFSVHKMLSFAWLEGFVLSDLMDQWAINKAKNLIFPPNIFHPIEICKNDPRYRKGRNKSFSWEDQKDLRTISNPFCLQGRRKNTVTHDVRLQAYLRTTVHGVFLWNLTFVSPTRQISIKRLLQASCTLRS